MGEYFPTFRRCVVLSYLGSSTARSQDVECLIQTEVLRYFETSGNVYRPTSKGKCKVHPGTGHEGPKVKLYSSTLSLTSPLDWVGGERHAPAASLPRRTQYPLYRRLGRSQSRSGRVRKISPPTGIRSPDRPVRSESLYRLSYAGSLPTYQ